MKEKLKMKYTDKRICESDRKLRHRNIFSGSFQQEFIAGFRSYWIVKRGVEWVKQGRVDGGVSGMCVECCECTGG